MLRQLLELKIVVFDFEIMQINSVSEETSHSEPVFLKKSEEYVENTLVLFCNSGNTTLHRFKIKYAHQHQDTSYGSILTQYSEFDWDISFIMLRKRNHTLLF
ncbi:hypothetical protein AYI68_g8211 [Smittium mucronatum]|uniref:Uncharacterized protein n=1 Tax=Smittium mucronatum TaxID=133383 RepID=A0A1R0GLK4_9FUNG|nr:hypothetical protein AYI68_g8211 [Smittium mucronatum]